MNVWMYMGSRGQHREGSRAREHRELVIVAARDNWIAVWFRTIFVEV